jgi:hypothetical protein
MPRGTLDAAHRQRQGMARLWLPRPASAPRRAATPPAPLLDDRPPPRAHRAVDEETRPSSGARRTSGAVESPAGPSTSGRPDSAERLTEPAFPAHHLTPNAHWLRCEGCGETYADDGLRLICDHAHEPALLTSHYREATFTLDDRACGLFRYGSWLPCSHPAEGESAPATVTYRSEGLNNAVGLPNLWIAFNGYWPERGALCETATFKDLEASAVLARLPLETDGVLVVASAGNTAAAFARACSRNNVACVIVIPGWGLPALIGAPGAVLVPRRRSTSPGRQRVGSSLDHGYGRPPGGVARAGVTCGIRFE